MREKIEPLSWQANLADFNKRNKMRPTRLEVLGPAREVNSDFWLEDGLLFAGIALEPDGVFGPFIEVMLQAPGGSQGHMTHTVTGVKRVELDTTDGLDEGLEMEDREGAITIMRFGV